MTAFDDAIDLVVGEILPKAREMSKKDERAVVACLMTLIRPHITACIDPDLKDARLDNRTRKWNVRLTFAVTDGDFTELISESEPEAVQGFDEVIEMLLEYVKQTHENSGVDIRDLPSLSITNLKKRLGGMRPAISKGGGYAHTMIRYMVNEHYYVCKLEISRENIPLDKPA